MAMRQFKAESKKLLDLMINSIYTNREIFLRELISNASDACDKLYFKSLTDTSIGVKKEDLSIHIAPDKETRTLTVSDNGIGMTKEELEKNLGTIARSGSMDFKAENKNREHRYYRSVRRRLLLCLHGRLQGHGHLPCPGQRRSLEVGVQGRRGLHSDGGGEGCSRHRYHHGAEGRHRQRQLQPSIWKSTPWWTSSRSTAITSAIPSPCTVRSPARSPSPRTLATITSPSTRTTQELETVNSMTPIWKKRQAPTFEQKDYNEFYKSTFHDFDDPARTISFHAEGTLELRRPAVCAGPRAVRFVQQGLREGSGALQLQRADYGEVRRPAARLLQLCARCRGHLPT